MAGTVLASVPVNVEAGSYLTFAFPVICFVIIGAVLYVLLFGRPVPRVPARRIAPAHGGPLSPEAAHAAAVAGGLPVAAGGGTAESGAEAAGAASAAASAADAGPAGAARPGAEAPGGGTPREPGAGKVPGETDQEQPTDGTEASE